MTKRSSMIFAGLACLALLGGLFSSPAAAAPKKKAKLAAKETAGAEESQGADKGRFEAYLRERLAKVQDAHKARMDFFDQEKTHWDVFWTKIRDDRKKFEIRITRQTLDMFESLASLDPKDHPATVANFEKLQGDLIKSFEQNQKQRMQDFFNTHENHWKDFAALQEKERAQFMADAEAGWQQNKAGLKDQDRPGAKSAPQPSAKASKPAEEPEAAEDEPPPPPKKKARKAEKKVEKAEEGDSADSGDSSDAAPASKDSKGDVWH